MASIQINRLGKIYTGDVRAVSEIDLTIKDGEFIVLVGPSGCGKSTLLRMIAGLESISEGDLFIGERRVNDLEPSERDIAMVFQNYALYPHMTVYNNLGYGLKNRGFSKDEIKTRVDAIAKMLEITPFLERKPKALSGGQRQRVAMGRALVREPKVFLLDEPLSNLDAKLRVQMRLEIKQLQKRLKTTSLYVTHDQLEAMTLADRLVVLNQGRIEQVGSPMDVYNRPETLFVAQFIGSPSMNLIPFTEFQQSDNQQLLSHLPATTDILGIRPDQLLLSKPKEDALRLDCQVCLFEPAGAESHLYVKTPSGQDLTLRVDINPQVRENTTLSVYIPLNKVHPFNQSSQRRTDTH